MRGVRGVKRETAEDNVVFKAILQDLERFICSKPLAN